MCDFGRSILQPPISPSLQLGTYHTSPPSVLHPAHLCLPTADPRLCSFIFALQLLPKTHLCPPRKKTLHLPCALTPCPSASFFSFPALVLQTEVPQSTGGQPSTREWELHKNINLCSSPTTWPLIQLFFLAFASSFLAAPKSLPVQLQLLFRFHWNLLRFLNMLRDIFFPNFLKGALKTQGMRSPISIPTLCHFCAGRNQVQQDFWRAKFHISRHMQTDSERFNWLGTVKQKTHYQNYRALNTPPREHVSSANARPAEKRENSITQRTGYSTLTH